MSLAAFARRGSHHLAEHGTHHALRVSLSMAVGALSRLGTLLASGAGTVLTQSESVDLDVRRVSEHGGFQIDSGRGQRISSRLRARGRTTARGAAERAAGEHIEDVPHVGEPAVESAASGTGIRIIRVDARIEHLAFLGIRQHLVCVVDFLEFVFKFRTGDIGVIFAAHLSIRLFDLVLACGAADAQHFVIVRHGCSFSLLVLRVIVP